MIPDDQHFAPIPTPEYRDADGCAVFPGSHDWVILGGESGPGCRRMDMVSACALKDACLRAHVPFFFKQWGGAIDKRADEKAVLDGRLWKEMPT